MYLSPIFCVKYLGKLREIPSVSFFRIKISIKPFINSLVPFSSRSDKYLRLPVNFISREQRILKRITFIINLVRSFDINVRNQ